MEASFKNVSKAAFDKMLVVPARKIPSFFVIQASFCFVVMAMPTMSNATRSQLRSPTAQKIEKSAEPIDFSTAAQKETYGLDLEPAAARKRASEYAKEYVDFRKGRVTTESSQKWAERCENANSNFKADEMNRNPFCDYERERTAPKSNADAARTNAVVRGEVRRSIVDDLKAGKFETAVLGRSYVDIVYAASNLESSGGFDTVVEKVLAKSECVPTQVATALAYKLEDRFPSEEAIQTAQKLYEKSSSCGRDYAAAQASFRLGLLRVWKNGCVGVQELMARVEVVPEASMFHARAKYWRHHCASNEGDANGQMSARNALVHDHPLSFQTLAVAGDDDSIMGQVLKSESPKVSMRSTIRPDANPLIRGFESLVRAGATHLAAEVAERKIDLIGSMEPEVRLHFAIMLNRTGYALPKFRILSGLFSDAPRTVSEATLKLFFPLWYYDVVKEKKGSDIDPLLILSLIRQESAFNKDARSIAGARGLMQVMPATARSVASVSKTKQLFNPATNIGIGTKYFARRLNQLGGDVELTLAAYNAGYGRIEQWKKRYPTDNKILFLDLMPYRETRDYVSAILRNYYWYVKLYPTETVTITEGRKPNSIGSKALAIINANAGATASPHSIPEPTSKKP